MPPVRPFRAIAYALDRFAHPTIAERIRLPDEPDPAAGSRHVVDLTDLACPPYDVITPEQQADLMARHPRNAIRLELPTGQDPYAEAAGTLRAWLADGTLERRSAASIYYYAHGSSAVPGDPTVQGVLARVLLQPFGAEVRAHEHTMPGPKADRLAHLRASRTQVSPILGIYFDASERYRHVMSRAWTDEWRARDSDGILHTVAEVEPDDRLLGYLARQRLYIADGHHRYETALAYQTELRATPEAAGAEVGELAADWIMMVLVNAEMEELDIRPTHRLIRADVEPLVELLEEPGETWHVVPVPPESLVPRLDELRGEERPTFGVLLPHGRSFLLSGDPDALAERMARERVSTAVARLDLAILQVALLGDVLGISAADVAAGERLAYTRSSDEAEDAVERGEAQAAILVRPTRLEELAAVAGAGDVMPQKSTYFYPKLLTGMVFNSLEV
jgi:uncharacterized protein (DUF1015 family)